MKRPLFHVNWKQWFKNEFIQAWWGSPTTWAFWEPVAGISQYGGQPGQNDENLFHIHIFKDMFSVVVLPWSLSVKTDHSSTFASLLTRKSLAPAIHSALPSLWWMNSANVFPIMAWKVILCSRVFSALCLQKPCLFTYTCFLSLFFLPWYKLILLSVHDSKYLIRFL